MSISPTISEIGKRKRKDQCTTSIVEMRKGVWTQEEEAFALKLIEEFKEGKLPDISPKFTIRKLLEKKLHCAGMRISKKFGGQCFGKVNINITKLLHIENFKELKEVNSTTI